MNEPTFTTTLGGKPVAARGILKGFALKKQASSLVDYFGMNQVENQLFIQFNNGVCTIYSGVPKGVLDMAHEAPSIGKFFHSFIKGKYEYEEIGNLAIKPDEQEEDEDWDADEDLFPDGVEE